MSAALDRLQKQLVAILEEHLKWGRNRAPLLPEAGRLYWEWFCDLNASRTYHMAGGNPISNAEIEAWARLHRWPIEARHIQIIRAMDRAWLAVCRPDRQAAGTVPRSSGQAITPAAFDAVF